MAINTTPNPDILVNMRDIIQKYLEEIIEKQYFELRDQFLKKLEAEKATAIAGITLNLMKSIDFQTSTDRLVITLNKDRT